MCYAIRSVEIVTWGMGANFWKSDLSMNVRAGGARYRWGPRPLLRLMPQTAELMFYLGVCICTPFCPCIAMLGNQTALLRVRRYLQRGGRQWVELIVSCWTRKHHGCGTYRKIAIPDSACQQLCALRHFIGLPENLVRQGSYERRPREPLLHKKAKSRKRNCLKRSRNASTIGLGAVQPGLWFQHYPNYAHLKSFRRRHARH
jgi:hypothetical protein